jgi:hypothetical protein
VRWCGSSRPHSSETRSLHASSRQLSAGETSQQLACRHSWHVNTITHTAHTCMLCQCCAIMTHSANDGHVEQNTVLWTHVCSLRALAAMPCVCLMNTHLLQSCKVRHFKSRVAVCAVTGCSTWS